MNTLGVATKTIFLKDPGVGSIYEELAVEGLSYTLTAAGALVTSNVTTLIVGTTTVAVTFATDSDTTMKALATAIAAIPGVKSAVASPATTTRIITIVPVDGNNGIGLSTPLVTAGSGQTTFVNAAVDKRIFKGMLVELNADGNAQPLTTATASTTHIGVALENGIAGQFITVLTKAKAQVYGEFSISSGLIGPVAGAGFNLTSLYGKYTSTSVTATNIVGWALDAGTSAGDVTRVLLK